MGIRRLILGACCALAVSGCRSGGANNNQTLLERELRFQETELWRLRDEIDDLGNQLEMAQRENESLKKDILRDAPPTRANKSPEFVLPDLDGTPNVPKPGVPRRRTDRINSGSDNDPSDVDNPSINLGPSQSMESSPGRSGPHETLPDGTLLPNESSLRGESLPSETNSGEGAAGPSFESPSRSEPMELPAPPAREAPGELPAPSASRREGPRSERQEGAVLAAHNAPLPAAGPATKLAISKQFTGGHDRDGHPGHEGITIAFEPQDDNNRLTGPAGDVSIVLLDPAFTGPQARVARWDFKANEAAKHYGGKGLKRGYYFDLAWAAHPPANEKLQVFVRLITPDGARLVADQNIDVELPSSVASQQGAMTDEAFDASIDPRTGLPTSQAASDGSRSSRSSRLFGRSRMGGGPGLFAFDGHMLRNLSGGNKNPKPTPATPYRLDSYGPDGEPRFVLNPGYTQPPGGEPTLATGPTPANVAANYGSTLGYSAAPGAGPLVSYGPPPGYGPMAYGPPYAAGAYPPGAYAPGVYGPAPGYTAPGYGPAPGYAAPGYGSAPGYGVPYMLPAGAVANAGLPPASDDWASTMAPVGGPPPQSDEAAIEEPPAPRVSRPVWRPYR